jgi:hypothetical protein
MKSGFENKKQVVVLAVLGVGVIGTIYYNFFMDSSPAPAPKASRSITQYADAPPVATEPAPAVSAPTVPVTAPRQHVGNRAKSDEFHPTLRSKRKEEQIDPRDIDPTLRLDLLAKVQDVKLEGGQRNLFQFGEMVKVAPVLNGEGPIIKPLPIKRTAMGPPQYFPPPPPGPVVAPPPPPFTPKYYGLATKQIDGHKTAFFLDGEDIILATEGMTVKKRYKLMRINATSVVVQETESKTEQTVQISEDAGANLT